MACSVLVIKRVSPHSPFKSARILTTSQQAMQSAGSIRYSIKNLLCEAARGRPSSFREPCHELGLFIGNLFYGILKRGRNLIFT